MYGAVAQTVHVEHFPQFRDRAAHINLQRGNKHFKYRKTPYTDTATLM